MFYKVTEVENLKKLIDIASKNGYKMSPFMHDCLLKHDYGKDSLSVEETIVSCNKNREYDLVAYSFNDIVLDYENDGSISFLEALFNAYKAEKEAEGISVWGLLPDITPHNIRKTWICLPLSARLPFLFNKFHYLLRNLELELLEQKYPFD